MKKILLADDHIIVRAGIKILIEESGIHAQVEEAGTADEIVNKVKSNTYDLIVMDIGIPDSDFTSLMQQVVAIVPDTNLLIFSMQPEEAYGIRSLQFGVKGYLSKSASNQEIITAIKRVLNGEKYFSATLIDLLSDLNHKKETTNPFDNLSPRELEIAKHLNAGKSLSEICTLLDIQYSTVNSFKRRIFEKLGVDSVLSLCRLMNSFDIK
jgi:two-component system invasion response regulator UvrY